MNKRIISMLLVLGMVFALCACAPAVTTTAGTTGADATPAPSTEGTTAELPSYKVGVILYDLSNEWALNIKNAIETLGADLNITFEYAVGGTDPEVTVTDIQNFGASGCDGILNLHPGAVMKTLVEKCAENKMFIVTSNDPSSASPDYADFSKSEYFAGEVWEDDYQVAYDIAQDMIDKGAKTFALHGFPKGLSAQMDKRLAGAEAAITANAGCSILTQGLDFNKTGAAENIISQFPDVDAIFSSVETVSTVYQPLVNANLGGKVMLNCYDPADGALEAMEEGVVNYAVEGTCADSQIALILLYNAMSGNKMTKADGSAASIEMNYIVAKSADEFAEVQKYVTGDVPPYTFDELKPFITAITPAASFDDLAALAGDFSLEDVIARHG